MNCPRCSGSMVHENFYGAGEGLSWYYPGWRCLLCGEIVDKVILSNRKAVSPRRGGHARHNNPVDVISSAVT